ncbi:hypothetical protein Kisp01_70720 [Kineosporia sp. NBRC 101677]|uniref:hypothetical protein n=1 Tax=Kineosporia sp. NBRC 101677 TaxID=3032197 RepID=UPI0024A28BDF|nr:hypothetical protein [Kineosporia sp. NBRC 101677]GLY20058.1 hypothetical protein Kisp01_70720 [Kineosporia sp. NBRC 101677]
MVVLLRMAEIALGLAGDLPARNNPRQQKPPPPPVLVATPTEISGILAPEILLDRLTRAELEGWHPWTLDLEQALLRLPKRIPQSIHRLALQLQSDAGRRFADWMSRGKSWEPQQRLYGTKAPVPGTYQAESRPGGARYVELTTPDEHGLSRSLFNVPTNASALTGRDTDTTAGLHLFPDHQEVIAAWALTAPNRILDGTFAALLPRDWPRRGQRCKLASSILLAYMLGSGDALTRQVARDAICVLAASNDLNGGLLGQQCGALIADKQIVARNVYAQLAKVSQRSVDGSVRDTIMHMLPYVLGNSLAGLAEVLEAGADLVMKLGRGPGLSEVPGLQNLTLELGTGKTTAQARRLLAALETARNCTPNPAAEGCSQDDDT